MKYIIDSFVLLSRVIWIINFFYYIIIEKYWNGVCFRSGLSRNLVSFPRGIM
jgi:hypothetical protein